MLFGAGQLDSLVYWLMALDVDFDVLEPPALKERLRRTSERVGRSLARVGGCLSGFETGAESLSRRAQSCEGKEEVGGLVWVFDSGAGLK
ncbi:MAG: hypothetical protein CVU22_12165 [Betaproteobacteria bacterium HGW-Betaproteobacteria-16]|nr:MAG: hypothetical protein CVU22_12165 [Betaproteobacteria bacterium HGW-Betaproteobacteria-16]